MHCLSTYPVFDPTFGSLLSFYFSFILPCERNSITLIIVKNLSKHKGIQNTQSPCARRKRERKLKQNIWSHTDSKWVKAFYFPLVPSFSFCLLPFSRCYYFPNRDHHTRLGQGSVIEKSTGVCLAIPGSGIYTVAPWWNRVACCFFCFCFRYLDFLSAHFFA